MTIQLGVTVRNAMADAIESTIGTSPKLRLYTGALPASCAATETGTLLAEATLPSDYLAAAANGGKVKSGTWEDSSANASGTAAHFRIYDSTGTTCHLQGTVTASGGGGDMTMTVDGVSSAVLTSGFDFTVATFTLTIGSA